MAKSGPASDQPASTRGQPTQGYGLKVTMTEKEDSPFITQLGNFLYVKGQVYQGPAYMEDKHDPVMTGH